MDDLIRRFRDYQIEWLTAHNDIEFCEEEEKLIIEFLKDTAESFMRENQSAQQWIPCEKKMPKAEEKVWIQTQSGKACFAMYEDGTIPECDSNWSWFDIEYSSWDEDKDSGIIPEGWWEFTEFHPDCEFDCPVDEKVVAWMPLPDCYQGDGNNEM